MLPGILALGTAVPPCQLDHITAAELMVEFLDLKGSQAKRLRQLYTNTSINFRGTVVCDDEGQINLSFFKEIFSEKPLGMTRRNAIYQDKAPQLAYQAAQSAIENWGESPQAITHVISITCTGIMTPGLELCLVNQLGLSPHTFRLGINFMGCFGALKGLAVAKSLAKENRHNRILMVCTELCSLHMQPGKNLGVMVSNAIFADGAAACIVGCDEEASLFTIQDHDSCFVEDTLDLMQWNGSDYGMQIQLSCKVPEQLNRHIEDFVKRFLERNEVTMPDCEWVIHPGGKAIIEGIEAKLNLNSEQTSHSWNVLKNHGNMSSPTVLFVLDEMSQCDWKKNWGCMLGFGPGLSMEGILLCKDRQKMN